MGRLRTFAVAATAVAVATVTTPASAAGVPAESTSRVRAPVEMRLGTQPVRLRYDGSVPVALRIRCRPGVQPFELHVGVTQRSGQGTASRAAPPLVTTCDDTWQRVVVRVAPAAGRFTVGPAGVTADLFAYLPPPDDHDTEVGLDARVWVGPRMS